MKAFQVLDMIIGSSVAAAQVVDQGRVWSSWPFLLKILEFCCLLTFLETPAKPSLLLPLSSSSSVLDSSVFISFSARCRPCWIDWICIKFAIGNGSFSANTKIVMFFKRVLRPSRCSISQSSGIYFVIILTREVFLSLSWNLLQFVFDLWGLVCWIVFYWFSSWLSSFLYLCSFLLYSKLKSKWNL